MKQKTVKNYRLNSDLLRKSMTEKNLNQSDVAVMIGVSRMSVTNWLNHINFPREIVVDKLSSIFGIDSGDLIIDV